MFGARKEGLLRHASARLFEAWDAERSESCPNQAAMVESPMLDLGVPASPVMVMRNRITNQVVPPAIPLEELAAETEICPKSTLPPRQEIWRYMAVDKFID